MLLPDSLNGAVTGCEFVEVLRAGDGTQVVTGLCSSEGEEAMHLRQFIIGKVPGDGQALLVFQDGALWSRVAACR